MEDGEERDDEVLWPAKGLLDEKRFGTKLSGSEAKNGVGGARSRRVSGKSGSKSRLVD